MPSKKKTTKDTDPTLPGGEHRSSRKKWPDFSSDIVINIISEGRYFTLARASILIGKKGKRVLYQAEGISKLSPLDDPNNLGREKAWKTVLKMNPKRKTPKAHELSEKIAEENAIEQAIEALYTRVIKHRSSFHHYRG